MAQHKEKVVISGIGGMYPESNNLNELKQLLFNKTNGITVDNRRWRPNELDVPAATGKLKDINHFDSTFFSAHPKLSNEMDPLTKLNLERSIEAVIDAGLCPADLYGSNTGVFMGSTISETEMLAMDSSKSAGFSMLGRSKTMQANRVSYILNLTGPSYTMDGGWICGSDGLEKAKDMIENGIISSAIIGVANLVLRPEIQFQFQGLNRLNRGIQTKPFSSDADGYNRSEASIVMFLQKESEAKRSYGTLMSVKSVQFGDHQRHPTEHVGQHLKSLLLESYNEANIDPATVDFVEAYGSGIKNEDSMELNIMEEVFCTEQRKTPLKVGSVKSNIGHCEVSGCFMSIVKAIIALDSGYIPPNIHYSAPNENVPALKTNKIKVVTEITPLVGDIIGVTSFGFLNAFSHVILKRNNKTKKNYEDNGCQECIPQLILASGRTEENTRETIKKIKKYGNDTEFIALTNNVFTRNINSHFYRSFSIFPEEDETRIEDVLNVNPKKRPVWFVFSGMGSQWQGMGTHLMKLPIFGEAINKCDSILQPLGVDIKHILTSQETQLFDNILNSFVGIAAVQIGLVAVLKALDITPDGIIGHSVGELGCAYADGCFTAEEMILAAYARGRASIETDLIPGMMAAIGLGYDEIKDRLPHDVDVACRNSASSCTISGPVESINEFVSKLKAEGIFAKAVNVAGIAYHSRYIQPAGPTLLKYLKEVIKEPKPRSSKWISSSIPEAKWDSDLAKYSSPEYHTNNLLSSVLFEDALKHIPSDAIVIEIAPHGLLQSILKGALPEKVTNITLTKKMYSDSIRFLLNAIGNTYNSGLNLKIQGIYPSIAFPVSRGTPSLDDLPIWDYSKKWSYMKSLNSLMNSNSGDKRYSLRLNDNVYLAEHQINGQYIIPLSFVLFNVWQMFVEMNNKQIADEHVQFKNLRFKNNFQIHHTNVYAYNIMIQSGSGLFEYNFDNEVILSGQICFLQDENLNLKFEKSNTLDKSVSEFHESLTKYDIYTVLENKGLSLGNKFKNIANWVYDKNIMRGYVEWKKDWIYFLSGLLRFPLLDNFDNHNIEAPVSIRQITIIPSAFEKCVSKDIYVNYNTMTKELTCEAVKISDIIYGNIELPMVKSVDIQLEGKIFNQFNNSKCKSISDFINNTMDIIMEADNLGLDTTSRKLVLCTPYHYNDSISKECTKTIKSIIENQKTTISTTLDWDSVTNKSQNDELGRFITITNVNYLKETTKALANKKCSYVIVCSKDKIQDLDDWKIITQQKFKDNNHLALMKKKSTLYINGIFKELTQDNYDLTIWNALKMSDKMVYIVSKFEPLESVKEMMIKYKSTNLRFLFILDPNAPEFESNKSFYEDQLSLDLIVNIYKNGSWGTYKRIALQHLKDDIKISNNSIYKNFTINSQNKLKIEFMGLNFNDLVVEDSTENQFGPLEYSGFVENNKRVMGISLFDPISSKLQNDALLSWPVPSTWSLEEAATVPLSYAMAYYIFTILCSPRSNSSIVVTSGLHPIGQAVISISLAEKYEAYAVVDSNQQADQLSAIFPKLSSSRIIVNTNNKFDIKLKMMNSKGFDYVFNFLSGESFQSAIKLIGKHGKLFQFSKSDMKNKENLGMKIFLNNISFSAISPNLLLNESDHNKKIVHQTLMNGLNKGVVRPFHSRIFTTSLSSSKMFDAMRTASASIKYEKVVLLINDDIDHSQGKDDFDSNSYKCHPDQVYVIIGNKSDWLYLAEWLVDRGAKKLVVTLKRCTMSSIASRRFDRLISRNVSVQIESNVSFETKEESLNWLNCLTLSNILGSLIIVDQLDDNKINNLRYAFEKHPNKTTTTSFICIFSRGGHICAELKSTGLSALNISWNGVSPEVKNVAKILPSLDALIHQSNNTESSSFICSPKCDDLLQWHQEINDVIDIFFPKSADELHLLNDKSTQEAEFVEVQTKSPRFCKLKSVSPVFVIPGFKPKLIEHFYKELFYPVFEARLPENIDSIDELSEVLVNKLQSINAEGYVSLIGESWGGIVALKMAQILEAQGSLVTVSLVEGDPEFLNTWAKSFLSNEKFINQLNSSYSLYTNKFSNYALKTCTENLKLQNLSSHAKIYEENSQRALNTIRSRLQAMLDTKPLSNKLHTKVLTLRYEKTVDCYGTNINDYYVHLPFVHNISKSDYKNMTLDKKTIEALVKNVTQFYPIGTESSLVDKYKNYYGNIEKIFKIHS